MLSLQLCLTLCHPMSYNPPGFSVHGILQARILEWDLQGIFLTQGLNLHLSSALAGRFFTNSSTWEASLNYKASRGAAELEGPDWELLGGAPGKTPPPERQEVAVLIPLLHPHDGRVSFFLLLSQLLRRP